MTTRLLKASLPLAFAMLSSLARAESCADLGALLGRPDELAKVESAATLMQCTGRTLVWISPRTFGGSLLQGHYELVPESVGNRPPAVPQVQDGCFRHAKTMLVHSDRCKTFEARVDALSAQNNSCANGFVVSGLMTIRSAAVAAGCDYRP